MSTRSLKTSACRPELRHVVRYFQDLGHKQCELAFGWRWGMDYPPPAPWETMRVLLADVETEVRKPEDAGLVEFEHDDVTVRVPPVDCEFMFCHHQGIHLTFSLPGQVAKDFLARWTSAGLAPVERDCARRSNRGIACGHRPFNLGGSGPGPPRRFVV